MPVLTVRFQVRPECVDDVVTGIGEVIAALDRQRPPGARDARGRSTDGTTFVAPLELASGVDDFGSARQGVGG